MLIEDQVQEELAHTCANCKLVGPEAIFSAKAQEVCCPHKNPNDWAPVPDNCLNYIPK